jgi:3-phenylpropionate/trans-cinnamate dioxygenase ferredoxin subunit
LEREGMSRYQVANVSDLAVGEMMKVAAGGRFICLAHLEDHGFRAIDDTCSHEEESLSEGWLCEDMVECPAHSSRFSFLTGEVTGVPAWIPVTVYEVTVEGEAVMVEIADD